MGPEQPGPLGGKKVGHTGAAIHVERECGGCTGLSSCSRRPCTDGTATRHTCAEAALELHGAGLAGVPPNILGSLGPRLAIAERFRRELGRQACSGKGPPHQPATNARKNGRESLLMTVRSGGLPSSPAPAGRCILHSVFRKAKKRDPRTKLPRGPAWTSADACSAGMGSRTILRRSPSWIVARMLADVPREIAGLACRPYACGGASQGCRTLQRRRRRRDTRRVALPYVLERARCLCSGMGTPCRKLCIRARAAPALRGARLVCPARGWPSCSDARALRHVHRLSLFRGPASG
jgi:hypothetical protein